MVVGVDLVSSKPHQLTNYHFVYGNVLQGLPYANDRLDFVHQRSWASARQETRCLSGAMDTGHPFCWCTASPAPA
jgi:hypothetical protein